MELMQHMPLLSVVVVDAAEVGVEAVVDLAGRDRQRENRARRKHDLLQLDPRYSGFSLVAF